MSLINAINIHLVSVCQYIFKNRTSRTIMSVACQLADGFIPAWLVQVISSLETVNHELYTDRKLLYYLEIYLIRLTIIIEKRLLLLRLRLP